MSLANQTYYSTKNQSQEFNQTLTLHDKTKMIDENNPASLKAKLTNIDQLVKSVSDQLSMHKKELTILRSEKDTLEGVLSMKIADVKKTLQNELNRLDEEIQRYCTYQLAENHRVQSQLNILKQEKSQIQQQLIVSQRRVGEIEASIGLAYN